ncbi:MAG: FkbM family methyltransferase [Halioglobus sp.]
MRQITSLPYAVKKRLFWPRTCFMRWKFRGVQDSLRAMLELHYYSPAIIDFLGATVLNPHVLHDAAIDENGVVLDVGAFTGKWAQTIVDRYNPTIYAFEPNPESFARLERKAATSPKIKPLQYGLADREATVDFTLNGLGSSMYDERAENAEAPRIQVRMAAIDKVWKELALGDVDLMKINIEGAEFPLLACMIGAGLLPRVDCFLIQFHEWHPGAHEKRRQIQSALSESHRQEWNYDFVWEKWVRK